MSKTKNKHWAPQLLVVAIRCVFQEDLHKYVEYNALSRLLQIVHCWRPTFQELQHWASAENITNWWHDQCVWGTASFWVGTQGCWIIERRRCPAKPAVEICLLRKVAKDSVLTDWRRCLRISKLLPQGARSPLANTSCAFCQISLVTLRGKIAPEPT